MVAVTGTAFMFCIKQQDGIKCPSKALCPLWLSCTQTTVQKGPIPVLHSYAGKSYKYIHDITCCLSPRKSFAEMVPRHGFMWGVLVQPVGIPVFAKVSSSNYQKWEHRTKHPKCMHQSLITYIIKHNSSPSNQSLCPLHQWEPLVMSPRKHSHAIK